MISIDFHLNCTNARRIRYLALHNGIAAGISATRIVSHGSLHFYPMQDTLARAPLALQIFDHLLLGGGGSNTPRLSRLLLVVEKNGKSVRKLVKNDNETILVNVSQRSKLIRSFSHFCLSKIILFFLVIFFQCIFFPAEIHWRRSNMNNRYPILNEVCRSAKRLSKLECGWDIPGRFNKCITPAHLGFSLKLVYRVIMCEKAESKNFRPVKATVF